ncbi:hypothetical protein H4R34_000426 [Dimargaris verticillata]|uniref:Uncharacterized protein n=1 Tax=Dimargaris verticillata TaxID=2761393 RepID=A0A9W8EFE3_9FUNG|nr:hypothetical protein H4R34_000426 [Dimargaris verticillata]
MASLALYTVDAFVAHNKAFTGNPAAVCLVPPNLLLTPDQMQRVAQELNLSETAFVQPLFRPDEQAFNDGKAEYQRALSFGLRWFTPTTEVRLCGHATLAAAHVLFAERENPARRLMFETASGTLTVCRASDAQEHEIKLTLRLPRDQPHLLYSAKSPRTLTVPLAHPKLTVDKQQTLLQLANAFTASATAKVQAIAYSPKFHNLVVEFDGTQKDLLQLKPTVDSQLLARGHDLKLTGVIACCKPDAEDSEEYDAAVRYFAPWAGILEDPVTGSAYTGLAPYWSDQVGRNEHRFVQGGSRQGVVSTRLSASSEDIYVTGNTLTVIQGTLHYSP